MGMKGFYNCDCVEKYKAKLIEGYTVDGKEPIVEIDEKEYGTMFNMREVLKNNAGYSDHVTHIFMYYRYCPFCGKRTNLGRTLPGILKNHAKNKVTPKRNYKTNTDDAKRVVEMNKKGLSQRDIADIIGCSRSTVYNYLKTHKELSANEY